MGFRAEKDQEEKDHFTQSLEAIWGDKRSRIWFPSACLPFCCPENYAHRSAISHFLSLNPSFFSFSSLIFTLSVPIWSLMFSTNTPKIIPIWPFSSLSFLLSCCYFTLFMSEFSSSVSFWSKHFCCCCWCVSSPVSLSTCLSLSSWSFLPVDGLLLCMVTVE